MSQPKASQEVKLLHCGVVDFLNAWPLWRSLQRDDRFKLTPAMPSQLANMLRENRIDAGLLPAVEYFRQPDTLLVPGIGVVSRKTVASVRLFHKKPLDQLQRVRLDVSSRTSAALTQVILHDRYGISPEYVTLRTSTTDLESMEEDAALVIGDPALEALRDGNLESVDLAEEWIALTGKPFVFAAWVVRKSLDGERQREIVAALRESANFGQAHLELIARDFVDQHPGYGFHLGYLVKYLRENIQYDMKADDLAGLREFANRAAALGLCDKREIELCGD